MVVEIRAATLLSLLKVVFLALNLHNKYLVDLGLYIGGGCRVGVVVE